MAEHAIQKIINLQFDNNYQNPKAIDDIEKQFDKSKRHLKCYLSLCGSIKPTITVNGNLVSQEPPEAYRYDWAFGISCIERFGNYSYCDVAWDWLEELRPNASIKIQLIFETTNTSTIINEISTTLNTILPTKNSTSWLEKNAGRISEALSDLSRPIENISKTAGTALITSSILTSLISSNKGENWYIYRFLDPKSDSIAIEWNINKRVLQEHGSVLKGSIFLTFNGITRESGSNLVYISLKPQIGFSQTDELINICPIQKETDRIALEIQPYNRK